MFSLYLYMVILFSPFQNAQWFNIKRYQLVPISGLGNKSETPKKVHKTQLPFSRLSFACVRAFTICSSLKERQDAMTPLSNWNCTDCIIFSAFCLIQFVRTRQQIVVQETSIPTVDIAGLLQLWKGVPLCVANVVSHTRYSYQLTFGGGGVIDQVIVRTFHHSCQIDYVCGVCFSWVRCFSLICSAFHPAYVYNDNQISKCFNPLGSDHFDKFLFCNL